MTLLVNHKSGEHKNYYEGNHIGFHKGTPDDKEGLTVIIESKADSLTIELQKKDDVQLYLMNSQGKTIETRIVC